MNVKQAAAQVLKDAGEPLHVTEITRRISRSGLWQSKGKTPADTVAAQLYRDIKENGNKSNFLKTASMTFELRGTQPLHESGSKTTKPKYSFLDAAEKILDQFGDRNPMHYGEITDKAIELGWISTQGKTPKTTMNAQLATDLKRNQVSGESGRFARPAPGYYSLVKWTGVGLSREINQHNRKVKEKLLGELMRMSPADFEILVGELLTEIGFESIDVTDYSQDGGIDVRGLLQISDAIRIKMAVQVKRWKNNIQRQTVQQVRGSLGVHEQGMIITTSNFSNRAIAEANQSDKTPVALVNGDKLTTLLMHYNIGVRRKSQEIFELAELAISKFDSNSQL